MRPETSVSGAIVTAQKSAQAPATVSEAITMFGGGGRGKSALARELSGTSDKRTKEYKAALRNVERYYKQEQGAGGEGRRPGPAMREKLARIGRALAAGNVEAQMRSQGASIRAIATVRISDDVRERELPELYLWPEDMQRILDAYNAGDYGLMAGEFGAAALEAYDMPRNASITDYMDLDITAGATDGAVRYDVTNTFRVSSR